MTTRATHLIIVIVLTLYNAVGQELPAGVPRTIGPDGAYTSMARLPLERTEKKL